MSLIDKTYFRIDISVPEDKYSPIQDLIERYEKEVLISLLGLELYRKVVDTGNTDPEIVAIREGKDYTVDDVLYRWNGLVNDDKISLISYYIYYWYVRLNLSETANIGEVQALPEIALIANASLKIQDAWGRFLSLYGSETESTNYSSAYGFLNYFEDDYPEWQFTELGGINSLDL